MSKKTKIVCTIGPASWDPKVMKKMVKAGMNVARVNAAFTDVAALKKIAKVVRDVSDDVALMLDIKGNDVRLNNFDEPIPLKKGQELIIGSTTDAEVYPKNYLELYKDLKKGIIVYMDDGNIKAEVTKVAKGNIHCKILEGKLLNPGKSLNTPGVPLSLPPVTPVDQEQIDFCIKDGWDFVAASYIRHKQDALDVKKAMKKSNIQIIAKIEEELGVTNIDEILEVFDGVMIGRGDMGVEMPYEMIPSIQKMLIQKCNEVGKYVITATEVMDSMKSSPRPTRAEISDVANAVLDGTDAIMTSGETTVGEYPVETVEAIARIALEAEKTLDPVLFDALPHDKDRVVAAICNAALEVVETTDVDKLIIITQSGRTARFASRHNFDVPVITFVTDETTKRQLALAKGIDARYNDSNLKRRDLAIDAVIDLCLEEKLIKNSERILIIGKAQNDKIMYPHIFEYINLNQRKNGKQTDYEFDS